MPKVCVVLPTYNRKRLLARAVDSVLRQTYRDWELRIVDDGSTDGTEEMASRWAGENDNIHYVRQVNRGVSAARNRAIFATGASWIACLDSDDEWLPGKLEKQLNYAETHPDIRLVHGEEIWIRNGELLHPLKKHQKSGGRIFTRCLPICCISPSTVMLETGLVRSLGGFREDFPVCEDYDLWLKICATEEVGFIADPLIKKYGGHADQLSHSRPAMDEFRVRAMWEVREHPALSPFERTTLYEELLRKCGILIKGYKKHGHTSAAAKTEALRDQALHQFHQWKSAHSAAALAPRSELTFT